MFKGLGYDTKEAMELAGDSTQLAADAAAFTISLWMMLVNLLIHL